jgi:hypothetical protein
MLLSTPLKAETILNGQLRATLRQFQGPALLGLIMQLLAVVMIWYSDMFEELTVPISVGIAVYAAIYLLDIYTIAWMGMFGAVTVKDPKNAAGVAILRVIMLPGLPCQKARSSSQRNRMNGWACERRAERSLW